ncbi:MAG: ABC transporter permease subunit [Rhodothermales bacterium]
MQLRGILLLTFRELWAKKITVGLFIISTLIWVMLAFALNLDIVDGSLAGLRIFGQDTRATETITDPESGEVLRQGLTLEQLVMGAEEFVARLTYWAGILLALFATASLLPNLLERGRVDLLLSKPMSRTRLLAGHVLGVMMAMSVLAVYLFGMVWLVMSLKTGIWHPRFLLSIVIVVAMFAVMYSVVTLISVTARSAPLALIVAYGIIFSSGILAFKDELAPQINPPWRQVFLAFYHVLPNFGEVTGTIAQLSSTDPVASWYPFLSSLLFGAVLYAGTAFFFTRRDF